MGFSPPLLRRRPHGRPWACARSGTIRHRVTTGGPSNSGVLRRYGRGGAVHALHGIDLALRRTRLGSVFQASVAAHKLGLHRIHRREAHRGPRTAPRRSVLAGIGLGAGIAVVSLVPMMNGLTGQSPYIPPLVYGSFAGSVLVLGPAATALGRPCTGRRVGRMLTLAEVEALAAVPTPPRRTRPDAPTRNIWRRSPKAYAPGAATTSRSRRPGCTTRSRTTRSHGSGWPQRTSRTARRPSSSPSPSAPESLKRPTRNEFWPLRARCW